MERTEYVASGFASGLKHFVIRHRTENRFGILFHLFKYIFVKWRRMRAIRDWVISELKDSLSPSWCQTIIMTVPIIINSTRWNIIEYHPK